jgi:molybdopterin-containing oxidoreductase family membrane subunit
VAALPATRTIPLLFVVSIFANVGMWIKRLIIVVPSLSLPLLPYDWGFYHPTWVEFAITVASFAGFALIITGFAKLFPIISISEMEEEWQEAEGEPAGPIAPIGRRLQPGGATLEQA